MMQLQPNVLMLLLPMYWGFAQISLILAGKKDKEQNMKIYACSNETQRTDLIPR